MCYWTDINLSDVKFPSQKQLAIGIALLTTSSDNSRNYQKNVLSGAWICCITKHELHHAVLPVNFLNLKISENLRTATSPT